GHHRRHHRPVERGPAARHHDQSRYRIELRHHAPAIDNILNDAYGQRIVSTMYTQMSQYHVVLEVPPKYQYDPEALGQLYVSSSTGQQVPLRSLITSAVKVSPLVVNHQGQFPSVTISYNLLPGTSLGEAVASIQQVEKDLGKPLSLQTSFQGN